MTNDKLSMLLNLDRTVLPSDGGERYNRLIFSHSPYLLQHAENPVDWREWNSDAFAEARLHDRPLLISIGYSTCHWCHVMAAESFSDPEVAEVLNNNFITIKVDREEHPDIDEFCMAAALSLTGGGGWPLNVFMDHDKRPFFAMTYLPKLPRHNTPGFLDLLHNITSLWQNQRHRIMGNSESICSALHLLSRTSQSGNASVEALADSALKELNSLQDKDYGGFGLAVKFPMPIYLQFLLSRSRDKLSGSLEFALKTLDVLARSGINDQLVGGFHRYAVDRKWQVPHFEKMLYDQALLISTFVKAFQLTGKKLYLDTATATAEFTSSSLMNGKGFAAGLDADSEEGEGYFYTWRLEEFAELLGEEANVAAKLWSVTSEGTIEGRSILHSEFPLEIIAANLQKSTEDLQIQVNRFKTALLHSREQRERPLCDPKIITAWNGLMISALVDLWVATNDAGWLQKGIDAAEFILHNLMNSDRRLLRSWLNGAAPVLGFAEDYAFFGQALYDLALATKEEIWQQHLAWIANELIRIFIGEDGEISFIGRDAESLPVNIAPLQDNVIPSAAGTAALLLIKAGRLTADRIMLETAERVIRKARGITEKSPAACLSMIMAEEELKLISAYSGGESH